MKTYKEFTNGLKTYFTSDWHLGDDRINIEGNLNLLQRPFTSIYQQHKVIIDNFKKKFNDGDTLIHLGDVIVNTEYEFILKDLKETYPNSTFILIAGNYDEDKIFMLNKYFKVFRNFVMDFGFGNVYMNHYPSKVKEYMKENPNIKLGLTGHIHSLWKVKRGIINVGIDVNHFELFSVDDIKFLYNAIKNHYDNDVFLDK